MKLKTTHITDSIFSQFGLKFYLSLFFIIFLIVVVEIPASFLGSLIKQQTNCRINPYLVEGSMWKGSAVIGFSTAGSKDDNCKNRQFVSERFYWRTYCHWPWSLDNVSEDFQLHGKAGLCEVQINSVALTAPVILKLSTQDISVSNGELGLPSNMVEILGGSWVSLKPRANISIKWNQLTFSVISERSVSGKLNMKINNLNSLISPIKDLGSYEVNLRVAERSSTWTLTSLNGPLLMSGSGSLNDQGLHFSGQASAVQGYQESLNSLLSMIGQKNGDSYKIQF